MSVAFAGTAMTWDGLLRTWRGLEIPEGWRPELTVEGIHMTPPPGGAHNLLAARLHRTLLPAAPQDCELFQTQGVGVPEIGCIYVPDLCVVPRSAVPSGSDPVLAEDLLLAVEITSRGNAEHDRKKKKWAYAHGRIPQSLLVDRYDEDGPSVTLFTDPEQGAYRKAARVAFGQPITLGEPFGVELEITDPDA